MSDARAEIENLLYRYAELVDAGDFAGVGALFAHASYRTGDGPPLSGAAIAAVQRRLVILYEDGTPRTRHLVTNAQIDVDAAAGRATSRSAFTVLQAPPGEPIGPIVVGRYHDVFERVEGAWRFAERRILIDHVSDVSRHLRTERLPGPLAR
jgi:3-phenylpropionate/cinnamic acid dioxygenase small subunit